MAAVRGWTLGGAVVLALSTGSPVGCGSDACALSCEEPHARVLTGLNVDPLQVEMCLDGECEMLEDRRDQYAQPYGEFSGFFWRLPAGGEMVEVFVEVRTPDGAVLATLDSAEKVPEGTCCPYLAVEFDGGELVWVDR